MFFAGAQPTEHMCVLGLCEGCRYLAHDEDVVNISPKVTSSEVMVTPGNEM
jgi:hypothetical protein